MADTIIAASLTLDASQADQSVGDFRKELKQAQNDVVTLSEKFGATSKQALDAAKKAAQLKDSISDAKTLVDAFNPDRKFNAFAGAISAVTGGFSALQGVMGLLGSESEDLQKSLLKVQSALAISQGVDSIRDAAASVKTLGAQLMANLGKSGLIGVAIAGVTALGLALSGVFTKKQSADVKAYNDTLKDYKQAAAGAIQEVTQVKIAFEQAQKGVIKKDEALKIYNETLGDSLGYTNDLGTAEKNLADKADAYIKITALKAQANALFAKSAEQAANALIAQEELRKSGVSGGGLVGDLLSKVKADIEKTKADALSVQKLGEDLLRQAAALAQGSGVSLNPQAAPSKAGSDKEKAKKEEELQFSTEQDNRLQRIIDFNNNVLASRRIFLDAQKEMDDAALAEDQARFYEEVEAYEDAERTKAEIDEFYYGQRKKFAGDLGNALGALADLIGKQTAAGKALAIAQATMNTYVGISEVLRAKSVLPEPAATISKIVNVAAILATGISAVRNIVKTNVPGAGSGGSAPSISAVAPLQPSIAGGTQLNQQQVGQQGNAAVRAYITETDIQNNRERVTRLNRAARITG